MRLLHLTPLLALATAQGPPSVYSTTGPAVCPDGAPLDTLWVDGPKAYACAALTPSFAYCITASHAELTGGEDTCSEVGDCKGGMCVAIQEGGLRRVCWALAEDGDCDSFGEGRGHFDRGAGRKE